MRLIRSALVPGPKAVYACRCFPEFSQACDESEGDDPEGGDQNVASQDEFGDVEAARACICNDDIDAH
jgi:hypothetical protein